MFLSGIAEITVKNGYFYQTVGQKGGTAGPATSHLVVSARSKIAVRPLGKIPPTTRLSIPKAGLRNASWGMEHWLTDINGNYWMVYHAYEKGFHSLTRLRCSRLNGPGATGFGSRKNVGGQVQLNQRVECFKIRHAFSDIFQTDWVCNGNLPKLYKPKRQKLKDGKLNFTGDSFANSSPLLVNASDRRYEVMVEYTKRTSRPGLTLFYNEIANVRISVDSTNFTVFIRKTKFVKKDFCELLNDENEVSFYFSRMEKLVA